MDHLIKNCRIFYWSWKYWHSPMLHERYLVIVVAYNIYNECVEGGIDSEWEIEQPIDFWELRDVFAKQMLQYSPTHWIFPGDDKIRASTVHTKINRSRVIGDLECLENVIFYMFDAAQNKPSTRSVSARLCGHLKTFERHVESRSRRKHPRPFEACGADSYTICGLCNVHFTSSHKENAIKIIHPS